MEENRTPGLSQRLQRDEDGCDRECLLGVPLDARNTDCGKTEQSSHALWTSPPPSFISPPHQISKNGIRRPLEGFLDKTSACFAL